MVISIELARDFPSVPPILRCKYERHTFIESATYVINKTIHPGLEIWEPTNDLGIILSDICTNVFLRSPPTPMAPNWDSSYNNPLAQPIDSIKDNAILNRLIDSADPAPSFNPPQPSRSPTLDVPALDISINDFKKALETKSTAELEEISRDPHSFLAQWSRLAPLRERSTQRVVQAEKSLKLQEEVPKLESELEEVENVNQVLLANKAELEAQMAALTAELQSYESAYTKKTVSDSLLAMAQREELRSDDMATAFSRGSSDPETGETLDLDNFVKKFIPSRQTYRLRLNKRAVLLNTPNELSTLSTSSTGPVSPWRTNTTSSSSISSPPPSSISSNRPF